MAHLVLGPCPLQVPAKHGHKQIHLVQNCMFVTKRGLNFRNIHTYWFTSGKYSCTPRNCSSLIKHTKDVTIAQLQIVYDTRTNDTMERVFVRKFSGLHCLK